MNRTRPIAVARIEIRRRVRNTLDNVWQVVAFAVVGLFALPVLIMTGIGLFGFGVGIADGSFETPVTLARRGIVTAWVGVTIFGGYRAYALGLDPDRIDGLLTTISHGTLVTGLFLAECTLWAGVLAVILAPGAAAFGLGLGSPTAVGLFLATALVLLVSALMTGYLLALVARNMGTRSVLLTRLRTLLLVVLTLGYVGVFFTQSFGTVLDPLLTLLTPTPIGWAADLALLGSGAGVSLPHVAGAIVGLSGGLVLGWIGMIRLSGALWYADGVHLSHEGSPEGGWGQRLSRALPAGIAAVIGSDWTRARRAPVTLSFALYPLFILAWPIMTAIETGEVGTAFPVLVAVCGAWITGSLFTLNLLGHEGAVLPVTLLMRAPARPVVFGHVTAAILVGVPVTTIGTFVFALIAGLSPGFVVTLTASAFVLSLVAPLIATGIGTLLPRYDEVTVTRSTTAVIPSTLAFGGYSIALTIVAIPIFVAAVGAPALADVGGPAPTVIRGLGLGLTALIGLGAGGVSVRYALRRVETFDIDR